jgi:hypothetical protein
MLDTQITKLIGALPVGDPEQMRQQAGVIRAQAEALGTFAGHVQRTIAKLEFDGRAAKRMRAHLNEVREQAESTAARIESLATYLLRAAGTTQAAQENWNRRFDGIEKRLRESVNLD